MSERHSEFLESVDLLPNEEEIEHNYNHRERFEEDDADGPGMESALPTFENVDVATINSWISQDAHDLVLYYEVGGERSYKRRYKHPVRPPGQSGVTVGFGYDLGYHPLGQVEEAWSPRLSSADYRLLVQAVGRKGSSAQQMLSSLRHIEISWNFADEVYRLQTVPKYARWVMSIYEGIEKVHPHCFGALFSLVYNRGRSLRGNRRREMKNIADHIQSGQFDKIPDEIRGMKRIWAGKNLGGLLKRRDAEARLFEKGLEALATAASQPVVAGAPELTALTSAPAPIAATTVAAAERPLDNELHYSDEEVRESLDAHELEFEPESSDDEPREDYEVADEPSLWYPDAKVNLRMPTRGRYRKGYPRGAIVHFTAGRSQRGDRDAEATIKYGASKRHCYFCISSTGTVYQTAPLSRWGSHAGRSSYPGLGDWVSKHLVGIEICNAGRVTESPEGYEPYWNSSYPAGDPRRTYFDQSEVKVVEASDNIRVGGPFHAYTPEQESSLIKLLSWLQQRNPAVFTFDYVLGHDEVSPGRKDDPGGALSRTMPMLRDYLISTMKHSVDQAEEPAPAADREPALTVASAGGPHMVAMAGGVATESVIKTASVAAGQHTSPTPGFSLPHNLESVGDDELPPEGDGDADHWPDDDDLDGDLETFETSRLDQVFWPESEDASPEYAHVLEPDRALKGKEFSFSAADLESLIRTNHFEPARTSGRIIFGLRGALLAGAGDEQYAQVDRSELVLIEQRPDHNHFRCTIGVYEIGAKRLSGFIASTVPNRYAVDNYRRNRNSGNMLPSGCYDYVVGFHSKGRFPGCLRQDQKFTVLRSINDAGYDLADIFDPSWAFDNIHPAFRDRRGGAQFSSFGCQVIRGSCRRHTDRHSGEWAQFRKALGLSKPMDGNHGERYSYVLFTGLEAAIASDLRDRGLADNKEVADVHLGRLRQGARGDAVIRLQNAMSMRGPDGKFGPNTKAALVRFQRHHGIKSDGVYSAELDKALELSVMKPSDPPAASQPDFVASLADATVNGEGNTSGAEPIHAGLEAASDSSKALLLTAVRRKDWNQARLIASEAVQALGFSDDEGSAFMQLMAELQNQKAFDELAVQRQLKRIDALLADISRAAGSSTDAEKPLAPKTAAARARELYNALKGIGLPLDLKRSVEVLNNLRRARAFEGLARVGDRLIANGRQEPQVRKLMAQGLIDSGQLAAAHDCLRELIRTTSEEHSEYREGLGLLGRVYKQIYVDASSGPSLPVDYGNHVVVNAMKQSLRHYASGYDAARAGATAYHGVNLIALLKRAERDRIAPAVPHSANEVARAIIADLEASWEINPQSWDAASLGEAHLALGHLDEAADWYSKYVRQASPFELASSIRQLEEVWRLNADSSPAGQIVTGLKARLLQFERGQVELTVSEQATLGSPEAYGPYFEKVIGEDNRVPATWLQKGVERCGAIARINTTWGQAHGTGFLVRGGDFIEGYGDRLLLLTNNHVVSTLPNGMGHKPKNVQVIFDGVDEAVGRKKFVCKRVLWQSLHSELDATLVELHPSPDRLPWCPVADSDHPLLPNETNVVVIGHPAGKELTVSLYDSRLLDHGPKDLNKPEHRYLRYQTDTEGGSSGSPVFDHDSWLLVGLHHAGPNYQSGTLQLLDGKAGEHEANEGIDIHAIREQIALDLNGQSGAFTAGPGGNFESTASAPEVGDARFESVKNASPAKGNRTGNLVENIPRKMSVGMPQRVKVVISGTDSVQLFQAFGNDEDTAVHDIAVASSMNVQLTSPSGGIDIIPLKSEAQIVNLRGFEDERESEATWEWRLEPTDSGRKSLQLVVSAQEIDENGVTAQRSAPPQKIDVDVQINVGLVAKKLIWWGAVAAAGGGLSYIVQLAIAGNP